MKSSHRKHWGLLIAVAMLLLPGSFVWKAYRQEQLDSALLIAIKHNATETAVSLLTAGADPNIRDMPSGSRIRSQRLWDRLRGKKPPIETAPPALLLAVQEQSKNEDDYENLPLIKALLDKGADVNAKEEHGMMALLQAVVDRHPATIRMLLERGADVNAKDDGFDTPSDDLDGTGPKASKMIRQRCNCCSNGVQTRISKIEKARQHYASLRTGIASRASIFFYNPG
jgi:hypothetical protein